MKFFLDANIPYTVKLIFSPYGEVWHARDLNLQHASDQDIITSAVNHGALLVTRDLEFGNPYLYPRSSHRGVIIVRVPPHFTAIQITKVLQGFLTVVIEKEITNAVTVVEPGKIRVRK